MIYGRTTIVEEGEIAIDSRLGNKPQQEILSKEINIDL